MGVGAASRRELLLVTVLQKIPAGRRFHGYRPDRPVMSGLDERPIYSPSVNNDALPPAAVVLMVTVFSVAKRGR